MHGCVGNVKIFEMDLKSKVDAAQGALSLMYAAIPASVVCYFIFTRTVAFK